MAKYTVLPNNRVNHNGEVYEAGANIDLSEKEAENMVGVVGKGSVKTSDDEQTDVVPQGGKKKKNVSIPTVDDPGAPTEAWTVAELEDYAKQNNVEVKQGANKTELLEAINANK